MSPDELRAAADEMDEWVNPNNAFDICRDATRRLAAVIEHIERIAGSNRADSPYPFERYAHEDALRTLAIARGDTTNHERSAWHGEDASGA